MERILVCTEEVAKMDIEHVSTGIYKTTSSTQIKFQCLKIKLTLTKDAGNAVNLKICLFLQNGCSSNK